MILFDNHTSATLCLHTPAVFTALLRRRRVLALHRFDLAAAELANCPVDMLAFDWRKIAARIAADIAVDRVRQPNFARTFEGTLHLRAPAGRYAEII